MALRKLVEKITKPVEDRDREDLDSYCERLGCDRLDALEPRTRVRAAGEIRSVRIVPRAGAPALEVSVSDGRGSVTAVFLGRRKIQGVSPGRKMVVEGVVSGTGRSAQIFNPVYTLL
ncbi:MAG: OB-fold nucleic acid binding domain-containing protein [Acidimicrobiia bacterium]|nr:OB-fold nucleic acid binding domain-containing protein [Acidimicrobiia bacterium]